MDRDEAEFQAIQWKPNDKGLPGRRAPAAYLMRNDVNARRAYQEMRNNLGLCHEEAELRIERCFDALFRSVLLHEPEDDGIDDEELDRRPEMWVQLARGLTVEQIFPNLEDLGMIPGGRRLQ